MAAPSQHAGAVALTRMDDADPELMEDLLAAVAGVARRGAFVLGPEVEAFESEWADYCGTEHAVGVSSGTDALALALRALGIGAGDEVIVPANSFVATAEAVTLVGATPRLVDVEPGTALIDLDGVAAAIGPRTRAIVPVHLYGRTVDMSRVLPLARDAGIAVVEDAAQAHGAWIGGRRAGAVGDCGCFSFYPAKNLGAWGDGGAVVTDDDALADRIRLLRSHGERPRYHHRVPGTTARLDAIQAAVLRVKLRRLDGWNRRRRHNAAALSAALARSPVGTPAPAGDGLDHVFHQYVVTTQDRDALREHLAARGIATAVHYPVPIHRTDAYRVPARLAVAEALATRVCSLPMHPGLADAEIRAIAAAVDDFDPRS
jgi:dTDP-3-amino-3,4,6-trideoxy-alpha-D-glucose transaminase